eukprot:6768528-Alexandrium_andersonii.AAC.1
MTRGIRQGSVASPLLWAIGLDEALAAVFAKWRLLGYGFRLKSLGRRSQGPGDGQTYMSLPVLLFADDVTLLAESPQEMSAMVQDLAQALAKAGLALQPDKCFTAYNWQCDRQPVVLEGQEIPRATNDVLK